MMTAKVKRELLDLTGQLTGFCADYDGGDGTIPYGELHPIPDNRALEPTDYFVCDLLSGSHYSGDSVNRSNYRTFLERFGDSEYVYSVYGGHGTYAIAIRLDCADEAIREAFESLTQYPVLCDEDLSELEIEEREEAWEHWAKDEFLWRVDKRFNTTFRRGTLDDTKVFRLFHTLCERANEYWICDCGDQYIDIERVVSRMTREDLQGLEGDE